MPFAKGYKIFPPVTESWNSKPAVNVVNSAAKEPALGVAAVATAATVILNAVNGLFPNLISDDVINLINTLIVVLGPFILALFIRRKVFSPATVLEAIEEGIEATNKAAVARRPKI